MKWTDRKKMMISGGLTVLAAALALLGQRPWSLWAALGMAASTVGDGLLAGYPNCFRPVKNRLPKGGAVFFVAHCLYIFALVRASGGDFAALLPLFWIPAAIFTALTLLHGYWFYFRAASRVSRAFFAAAMGYLLTVGLHAALAVCVCARTGGHFALNVAGSALFYASDAILLARKYGAVRGKRAGIWIWLTYVPAQLCLMLGFFLG